MIGNSTTGASFGGLANYLEKDEKMEWKETRNLAGENRHHYSRMMKDTASMSRAEQPVYHLSVSYAPGDNPTRQMMIQDGEKILEKLGLEDHQAVFVAHRDTDHKHMHLMVNRVDPATGRAWNPWQDHTRVKEILGHIEIERGYRKVSALEHAPDQSLTRGEFQQLRRGGLDRMPLSAKAELVDFKKVFKEAQGWEDVRVKLAEAGCKIIRKGRGGAIEDRATGQTMKLSRVDRKYSLGRLEKRFGKYKEFEQTLQAHKELKRFFPENEQVMRDFARFARAQNYGSQGLKKTTQKAFKETLSKGYKMGKAIKGFTDLAASSNPLSGAAKIGLKLAKTISRNLNRSQGRGL